MAVMLATIVPSVVAVLLVVGGLEIKSQRNHQLVPARETLAGLGFSVPADRGLAGQSRRKMATSVDVRQKGTEATAQG